MSSISDTVGENRRLVDGSPPFRVAIVGGGPGGMFSAWQLGNKAGSACQVTLFEASSRLGGKIVTKKFPGVGLFEAGVAEIYDYSGLGPDPLRELITRDLDLEIRPISGGACVLDGKVLPDTEALAEHFSAESRDAALAFRARCASLLTPSAFYKSRRDEDNAHPWFKKTGEEILEAEVDDPVARRYARVMSHSDVAAPPHLTSGLNLLKNVLMDVDGYMSVYSVEGGNEEIVRRLTDELEVEVRLNTAIRSVEPLADGTYRLLAGVNGSTERIIVDYVILALPLTALSIMEWRSPALQHAMIDHIRHFDRPGHYLRASLLFERPFWREHVPGAWWMLDAFDGCCAYDEGARHDLGPWGVLGFLIAGNAALGLANMSDDEIEALCLDALPHEFGDARGMLVDRSVHRWMASVNAIPGGVPVRGLRENHQPDATRLPGVFVVGDYIFDATLNGVLDSSDMATEILIADVMMRRAVSSLADMPSSSDAPGKAWRELYTPEFFVGALSPVWGVEKGAKVLVAAPGSLETVAALRAAGYDAYGFEPPGTLHSPVPQDLQAYMLTGDPTGIPFADGAFDVVLEDCLCRTPPARILAVARELRRVARLGVFLGSVVSDLAIELVESRQLLGNVKTFMSRWEWSELLTSHGFDLALGDQTKLEQMWQRALAANAGPGEWCEDAEGLLYCFYAVADRVASAQSEMPAPARAASII